MSNLIEAVREFQENILGNAYPAKPTFIDGDAFVRTVTFLDEELDEFTQAKKLSDQADALVDLIYFALGALHQAGVDTQRVWNDVHIANMTKVRGNTKRNLDNDAAKPTDWKAPDHTWLDEA